MNFAISFKDGVGVTITKEQDFHANVSVEDDGKFINVFGGSIDDVELNNAISRGDDVVVFNIIDERLGGALSA